jgi:hypothetical protein
VGATCIARKLVIVGVMFAGVMLNEKKSQTPMGSKS